MLVEVAVQAPVDYWQTPLVIAESAAAHCPNRLIEGMQNPHSFWIQSTHVLPATNVAVVVWVKAYATPAENEAATILENIEVFN